jgi:hypothetical protein
MLATRFCAVCLNERRLTIRASSPISISSARRARVGSTGDTGSPSDFFWAGSTIFGTVAKYDPLRDFLNGLPRGQKQVTLGFKRVEELLGEPLPDSAREYEQWWRGGRVKRGRIDANWQDQVQQRAWEDIGWTVDELDLLLKNVTFRRK